MAELKEVSEIAIRTAATEASAQFAARTDLGDLAKGGYFSGFLEGVRWMTRKQISRSAPKPHEEISQ